MPRKRTVMILLALAAGALVAPAAGTLFEPAIAPSAAAATASAPPATFAVGVRTIALHRGSDRPLPTTIWYPADGTGAVADGRFPVVLLSHGLHGLPEHLSGIATHWVSAGFVVVAPAYPRTNAKTRRFDRDDVRHQPADAMHVLTEVLRLDTVAGDPFARHLNRERLAAAGHSAGGYTTAGMFGAGHDARLRAGIVIAGGTRTAFGGPAAALLYIHGDRDKTVAHAKGWAAYEQTPWTRAFLTLPGQGHGEFLAPGANGFAEVARTTTGFLRWTLYGDATAKPAIFGGAESTRSRASA